MSIEKQIEEMARIFVGADDRRACWETTCQKCEFFEVDGEFCKACFGTKALYNAGYRKQSEWISVEERLPKEDGKYIVHNRSGMVFQAKYYSGPKTWGMVDKGVNITHWMPMPEPPKKGGAE